MKPTLAEHTAQMLSRLGRGLSVVIASMLALSMVGSVLAMGTDTVAISGSIESNTWLGPTGPGDEGAEGDGPATGDLDLRVASGPCDLAADPSTFTDDATFSVSGVSLDLAAVAELNDGMTGAHLGAWCLHNASGWDGVLYGEIISSSSTEVGPCDPQEAAVDLTCAAGDFGELADQLTLHVSSCDGSAFESADNNSDGVLDAFSFNPDNWSDNIGNPYWGGVHDPQSTAQIAALPAGATCTIGLGAVTANYVAGDEAMLLGLSDSVSFDFAIDLREF